jgi:hypothetical protein
MERSSSSQQPGFDQKNPVVDALSVRAGGGIFNRPDLGWGAWEGKFLVYRTSWVADEGGEGCERAKLELAGVGLSGGFDLKVFKESGVL